MFDILRKEECQWVAQADLKSMLAGILLSHPGLEFLQVPTFVSQHSVGCEQQQHPSQPYPACTPRLCLTRSAGRAVVVTRSLCLGAC